MSEWQKRLKASKILNREIKKELDKKKQYSTL